MSGKEKKIQDHVLESAKNHLMRTFGIKAQESDEKKSCFFLINMLTENQDDDAAQHLSWSEKENGQMGLTFIVLGLIFMSNGSKISEENLFKFMRHLGFHEEDKRGQGRVNDSNNSLDTELTELIDGDIKKFVNEVLVSRQHYLVRSRDDTGDPEVESYVYTWGERARLEVKESDVLKMICELYECEPRMFKEQFDRVVANEPDADLAD